MSILLPYDLSATSNNKYLYFLFNSLLNENIKIVSSTKAWVNKSGSFKAVLIHWPEHLPSYGCFGEEEFINFTLNRLEHFKKISKIFYFIHNTKPHFKFKNSQKLYEKFTLSADVIFHFSDFSKKFISNRYKKSRNHFVIEHGNYIQLDTKNFDKDDYLKNLNLNPNKITVSTIGSIRNKSELKLLQKFAKHYLHSNCNFIYAGNLSGIHIDPRTSKKILYLFMVLIYKKLKLKNIINFIRKIKFSFLKKNLRVFSHHISDNSLVKICKASDILLICRKNNFNSGNIALGTTFGCILVGPDEGNIGFLLKKLKNEVYQTRNINYDLIVNKSLNKINRKTIKKNLEYALYNCDWNKLAKEYKKIFFKFNVL